MLSLLIFVATGAAAGVLAGLFGVGGGLIMVPALAFVLPALGVPAAVVMQVAIGTSLAVIGATSISSTRAHQRRRAVRWDLLRGFAPGLALGALGGAFVAHGLSGTALKNTVGVGALLVAAQMFFGAQPKAHPSDHRLPTGELLATGGGIGLLSALVGIGGGSLTVPYLSWRGVPMQQAVGTAAAGGIPIAWGGALGFAISGWHVAGLAGPHLGYISLYAFLGLAVTSVLTAPLGAHWAHALPARTLKRAFGLLLAAVGLLMLLR
jgi:uncharacterized membrane protein YfcA